MSQMALLHNGNILANRATKLLYLDDMACFVINQAWLMVMLNLQIGEKYWYVESWLGMRRGAIGRYTSFCTGHVGLYCIQRAVLVWRVGSMGEGCKNWLIFPYLHRQHTKSSGLSQSHRYLHIIIKVITYHHQNISYQIVIIFPYLHPQHTASSGLS